MRDVIAPALFVLLLPSCGGETSSAARDLDGGSDEAASRFAGAGGAHGGVAGAGATAGRGSTSGGRSSRGDGGASGSGGRAGDGGTGTGGAARDGGRDAAVPDGGRDPNLGFDCFGEECFPGNRCVQCGQLLTPLTFRCVPRPDLDPTGYSQATQGCDVFPLGGGRDCDGPEDCLTGEYCSATTLQCSSRASAIPVNCCFSCGAPPYCDYCRSNADCPPGAFCELGVLADLGGCLRQACETDSDCPPAFSCFHDAPPQRGYCHVPCGDGGPCQGSDRCRQGRCS